MRAGTAMPLEKLYLELSSACNLDCATCYRRGWSEAPRDLDEALFRRLAGEASRIDSLSTVVLGGIGEPTSSPLFPEALGAFPGKKIIVTTNGVGMSDSTVAGMAKSAAAVVLSVDGMDETFRRIRGVELDRVIDTTRRLIAARGRERLPRIEFQFTLSSTNAGDLPQVVELAAELGVNLLTVSHLLPQEACGAGMIMYGRYALPETRRLFDEVRLRAMRRGLSVYLPPLELKTERRCAFAEDGAAFVNASGEVVPCYRFSHDGTEFVFGREKRVRKHAFGSLATDSLESIWNSGSYARFRQALIANRYPSCPDCDLLDGCDMVSDTASDCWSGQPSCADCLWARGFMRCP